MTQEKLIKRYESNLEKVKGAWGNGLCTEKGEGYIKYAQGELKAAKSGGIEALKKYWALKV